MCFPYYLLFIDILSCAFAAVRCSAVLLTFYSLRSRQLEATQFPQYPHGWCFLSEIRCFRISMSTCLACTLIRLYVYMLRQLRETSTRVELNFVAVTHLLWDIRAALFSQVLPLSCSPQGLAFTKGLEPPYNTTN